MTSEGGGGVEGERTGQTRECESRSAERENEDQSLRSYHFITFREKKDNRSEEALKTSLQRTLH